MRFVAVPGFGNGPRSRCTCHLLLPQRVGFLLGDGGQMLHTDPAGGGSSDSDHGIMVKYKGEVFGHLVHL